MGADEDCNCRSDQINVRMTPRWPGGEEYRSFVQDVHGLIFEKETDANSQRLRCFLTDTRCVRVRLQVDMQNK